MTAHYPRHAPIDVYGGGEFRFAGMVRLGSLLALPSGIYGWAPVSVKQLAPGDFAAVMAEREELDFVLLGSGTALAMPPAAVRKFFSGAGLAFDVMDTGAAVRTYNIVLAERRRVAACFIATDR